MSISEMVVDHQAGAIAGSLGVLLREMGSLQSCEQPAPVWSLISYPGCWPGTDRRGNNGKRRMVMSSLLMEVRTASIFSLFANGLQ